MAEENPAAQRQTAVTDYFLSQQLLLFVFALWSVCQYSMAEDNPAAQRQTAVTAHLNNKQLLLFAFELYNSTIRAVFLLRAWVVTAVYLYITPYLRSLCILWKPSTCLIINSQYFFVLQGLAIFRDNPRFAVHIPHTRFCWLSIFNNLFFFQSRVKFR